MTEKDLVQYWLQSSQEDFEFAQKCFRDKYYHYCLFFCHLAIEKSVKGIIQKKTGDPAPFIHDLVKLCRTAGLPLTVDIKRDLQDITTFNVEARYDIDKKRLYKKATVAFTTKYLKKTERLQVWLKNQV